MRQEEGRKVGDPCNSGVFLWLVVFDMEREKEKGIGAILRKEQSMDSNLGGKGIWHGVRGWIVIYHHHHHRTVDMTYTYLHGWRRLSRAVESIYINCFACHTFEQTV